VLAIFAARGLGFLTLCDFLGIWNLNLGISAEGGCLELGFWDLEFPRQVAWDFQTKKRRSIADVRAVAMRPLAARLRFFVWSLSSIG
jgi:hypothetical protein